MGFFDSVAGTSARAEQNFCDYKDTFEDKPVLISCDVNMIDIFPTSSIPVCVKIQMDAFLDQNSPDLISNAEYSHISSMRNILTQHLGGRFAGEGIIASQESVFLIYYIPQRMVDTARNMLTEGFAGSFRHTDFSISYDPEGESYKKFLYPTEVQLKQIENNKILTTLNGYGDDGTKPRTIRFNIIFPNRKAGIDYYTKAAEKDFEYESMEQIPAPAGMVLPRYHLVLKRELPFDIDLLDLVDEYLLDIAKPLEGEYKSLETDIV